MRLPILADAVAIPLFVATYLYFQRKPERTIEEDVLMAFAGVAAVADTLFVSGLVR